VEGDELGKIDCGHGYNVSCIQQWLVQKNQCPICKATALS
jgi:E3 ubiquitin-protein ligase Arkadia